ncbi:hypothetical protein PI124_g16925 [Phytophthora idaei]|nr:hypothetical protein PI125_g17326 [Phytophthora idaei]KAG3152364.1 hypothetical protein PI126_g10549 [Phytophthora idaei]KAG3238108.1 hypothetical protein PI124_g16925 [Phytophthora idaei]
MSQASETQLVSVNLCTNFEISSPVRTRGRPKQKPKVKKAKKSIAIELARDDSNVHQMQLSLNSIKETFFWGGYILVGK